jgi:hypothetical protein
MSGNRHEMPIFQSDIFRNGFRKILRLILVEVFVILFLVGVITYYIFFQPRSHYFVTTTGGITVPLDSGKVAMQNS